MLIPLHTIIKKYNLRINGIVHCGGHFAEEHSDYKRAGINKIAYIEASPKTFSILSNKIFDKDVKLFNVACADYEGYAEMYCETANTGQSSSLLPPGTHIKHYPNIKFDHREKVKVVRMDSLNLKGYNTLMCDTQGSELMVLKGAIETTKEFDYIYLEVNRENLYMGAPMVEEIDSFLKDFTRVETYWMRENWGDALYIRKSLLP